MNRIVCALLTMLPLLAQNQASNSPALAGRIRALNEAIDANPANARDLEAQREQLLYDLIAASPGDVAYLAKSSSWTGSIEVVIGDDFATGASHTTHILRTPDASTELYFPAGAPQSSILSATIEGVQVRDRIAVSSLTPREALPMSCSLTGPQRTAVVMVTTPENPNFPEGITSSYLNQAVFGGPNTFPLATTLANFIHETSYGQTSVTGTVLGPYRLPQTPPYCDSPDYFNGAVAAASKDAPLDEYTRYVVLFPASTCQTSSGSKVSGFGTIGCPLQNSPLGAFVSSKSWIPVFPFYRPGVGGDFSLQQIFAHEYGHNLGLQHAHWERFPGEPLGPLGSKGARSEYGDVFDAMGPTYAGQFSASRKSLDLGWLRPSEFLNVTESGDFNLLPLETSTGLRGLRIRRDAETNSWIWVEYRQPIGEADRQFGPATEPIFNGASIRYEAPDAIDVDHRSDTYLLDFTATPTIFDSALAVGKTWTDPYSPLRLTVNSADGKQLSLNVAYDTPCAIAQRLLVPLPHSGSSNLLEITAPPDCNWTTTSRVPWITLNGPTSGRGNSTVSMTVAPNAEPLQRLGGITLDRQTIRVVQESSSRPTVAGMTPFKGMGQEGIFTFRFSNAGGIDGIDQNLIDFAQGNRSVCRFYLYRSGAATILKGAYASAGLLPLPIPNLSVDAPGCIVSTTASSFVTTATEILYTLKITFKEPGTYRVWGQTGSVRDVFSSTHFVLGQWEVPDCTASADVTAFTIPASGATGTAEVSASPTCRWTSVGNAPWILTSSGSLGNGPLQFAAATNPSAKERTGTIQVVNQTLRITQAGSNGPLISSVNTVWGGADISRNAWIEIKGKNIVPSTTPSAGVIWNDAPEFAQKQMPTSLAGIQVTINGRPAYIYFYCSAVTSSVCQQDQINVLTPAADITLGAVDVVVTNNGASTQAFSATKRAISPTLLRFNTAGYITSIHADGSLLGPASLYPGLSTPARPAEVVSLFGVGFGGTDLVEGSSTQTSSLSELTCTIGGVAAPVQFAGIVSPGLAQINVTVPALAAGEYPVSCMVAGISTSSAAKLAIQP